MADYNRLVVWTGLVYNDETEIVREVEVRDDDGRDVLVDNDGRTFVLVDGVRRDVTFAVTVTVR